MRHNPKGGDLDLADDVRRRCKKNSSVLSCMYKRTKEGCNHDSEVQEFTVSETGKTSSSEKIEGIWQKREL